MKIAVIGSGISGLAAGLALSSAHDVTLYEKRDRAGGHSATVDVDYDGRRIPVDTGFIVYNTANYPRLSRMFDHLGIETEPTSMSFSVSLDQGRFEWCGTGLRSIFAQRRNLFSPGFLLMLGDILRFNAAAKRDLEAGALCGMTFGDYIAKRRFSHRLRDDYIVPMTAAIWSTPAAKMLEYPAESLVRFLDNHRLIHLRRPVWRTVTGGSRNYVNALLDKFDGEMLAGTEAVRVQRGMDGVRVTDQHGNVRRFDGIVLAGHTDQTLQILEDADALERSVLNAIRYRPNTVWLHRDPELMPRRKDAWASWNYLGSRKSDGTRDITVTYWMNRLQNLPADCPLFITLNPETPPRPELTFDRFEYDHPQFDSDALDAQRRLPLLQGTRNTWYCGAWTGHGFHEDGLASGLEVGAELGCRAPWDKPKPLPERVPSPILEAAE